MLQLRAGTTAKAAPTIKLEIYEGPTYSATDDICYYRVKATVTGNPAPNVSFRRMTVAVHGEKKFK